MGAYQPSAAPRGPTHAQTMVYLSHDWSRMLEGDCQTSMPGTNMARLKQMAVFVGCRNILDGPTPSSGEQNSIP